MRKELEAAHKEYCSALKPAQKSLLAEIRHTLQRAESLGFVSRYFDSRLKSFSSALRNYFAHGLTNAPITRASYAEWLAGEKDILGARIVVLSLTDVVKIARLLLSNPSFEWRRETVKDFYKSPRQSGYRSWQLAITFHPLHGSPLHKAVQCEIQLRTELDDAWAEWEHEVRYKKPVGSSDERWRIWLELIKTESHDAARQVHELNVWLDRQRERFELVRQNPEVEAGALFDAVGPTDMETCKETLEKFCSETPVHLANLERGLTDSDVYYEYDPRGFLGLELIRHAELGNEAQKRPLVETLPGKLAIGSAAYQAYEEGFRLQGSMAASSGEHRQRFAFQELDKTAELLLVAHWTLRGTPKPEELFWATEQFRGLLPSWRAMLDSRWKRETRTENRDLARVFFNEYQAHVLRSASYGDPWATTLARFWLVKTNFAYELCTNYVWGRRHSDTKAGMVMEASEGVRERLVRMSVRRPSADRPGAPNAFAVSQHGANGLAVHVNLIAMHRGVPHLVVVQRSSAVATDRNLWQCSVSGVLVPRRSSIEAAGDIPGYVYDEKAMEGAPSVFLAAQRELFEELGIRVPLEQIRLVAVLDDRRSGQPIAVMEAVTSESLQSLRNSQQLAIENWEATRLAAVPMTGGNGRCLIESQSLIALSTGRRFISMRLPAISKWQRRSVGAIILAFARHAGFVGDKKGTHGPDSRRS